MGYTYKEVVEAFWTKKNRRGGGWCDNPSKGGYRWYYCDNGGGHYRDQVVVDSDVVYYLFHGREIARLEGDDRLIVTGYPSRTTRDRLEVILLGTGYDICSSCGYHHIILRKWTEDPHEGYDINKKSIILERRKSIIPEQGCEDNKWEVVSDREKILIGYWRINEDSHDVIAFRHNRRKYYYYKGMVFEPIREGYKPYFFSKEIPMSGELKSSIIKSVFNSA